MMGLGNLSLGLLLCLSAVRNVTAVDVKRYDGVHRIEKAQITARAVLNERDATTDGVCGTSSKLCPSSLDGGCCPDNYDCAKESCYATTRGPATCGTLTGWRPCEQKYGGGCCPDGYLCQTAGNCVPPSGSPYTLGCPASQFLCPSSLSYGCCPTGMACAVNQCYSTVPITKTSQMVITTTRSGKTSTYTTQSTTVSTPVAPTKQVNADADSDNVAKYFPSAIAKATPSAEASSSGSDSNGGLTKAQLAGIVTGAVAFLILVIVIAFVVIRHLNKVVAAVASSKSGGSQPQMRHTKKSQFEVDSLMMPPTTKAGSDIASSTGQTPTSFAGHYQPVSTVPSVAASTPDIGSGAGYFDLNPQGHQPQAPRRASQQSAGYSIAPDRPSNDSYGGYTHVRSWSDASDDSNGANGQNQQQPGVPQPFSPTLVTELDSRMIMPELPGSPGSPSTLAADDQRRSSIVSSISSIVSRSHSHHHQRMRSATTGTAKGIETGGLDNINEESSASGSPNNTLGPQQRKPSWAQGDDHRPHQ